jgi:transposase
MRQDSESFLRCLENALRHFGGVPLLLNLDNLKAAVLKADWFDPQINPKLAEFCRHYHIHVMPCRPQMPQHKGKVERAVSYVRGTRSKGDASSRWPKRTLFLATGKRTWPTNAFTARPANRSRILDRLLHHAGVIAITGQYRLRIVPSNA